MRRPVNIESWNKLLLSYFLSCPAINCKNIYVRYNKKGVGLKHTFITWKDSFRTVTAPPSKLTWNVEVGSHRKFSCDGIKANMDGVLKVRGQRDLRTLLLLLLVGCNRERAENNQLLKQLKHGPSFGGYSLLSPPGKIERRRAFLFFSSGAMGSGLEA